MNTIKRLALTIGVIGLVFSGLVGCAKGGGGGSGNIIGNASISGSVVTASNSVNGQPLSVTVSGLQSMSNSYYSGYNAGTLSFSIAINGQSQQLQTSIVTPSSYNSAQSANMGNYTVYSMAECVDTACQNVGLVIWISTASYYGSSNGSQMSQIGLIDNLSNGTIRAAAGQTGYPSNSGMSPVLQSGPALITQMQGVMQ